MARRPNEAWFLNVKTGTDAAIKQGTWLTTILWKEFEWSDAIKSAGGTWQDLMRAFKASQHDFLKWKGGSKSFFDAVEDLVANVIHECEHNAKREASSR